MTDLGIGCILLLLFPEFIIAKLTSKSLLAAFENMKNITATFPSSLGKSLNAHITFLSQLIKHSLKCSYGLSGACSSAFLLQVC